MNSNQVKIYGINAYGQVVTEYTHRDFEIKPETIFELLKLASNRNLCFIFSKDNYFEEYLKIYPKGKKVPKKEDWSWNPIEQKFVHPSYNTKEADG